MFKKGDRVRLKPEFKKHFPRYGYGTVTTKERFTDPYEKPVVNVLWDTLSRNQTWWTFYLTKVEK